VGVAQRARAARFINSGNLRKPRAAAGEWISHETGWVINDIAEGLVRSRPEYASYRAGPGDAIGCASTLEAARPECYLKPSPLQYYTNALASAGSRSSTCARRRRADASRSGRADDAYHDAVLGWSAATAKLDGRRRDAGGSSKCCG